MTTAATMMNLSLSYCPSVASSAVPDIPLWKQLNATAGPQPVLKGHHALTTVFEQTEWMIVTGGEYQENVKQRDTRFNVWLLNLTHADMFGEEQWLTMDGGKDGTSGSACTPFVFNATLDPWERSNLWEQSVECAPTPRREHLAAVVNDELFVFQGDSGEDADQDYGVYRISLSKVLADEWAAWQRILPRELLNSTSTTHAKIKGGLWYREAESQLPRLVAFANQPHEEARGYWGDFQSDEATANQVWTYDFSEDSWELWYEQSAADFNTGDYSAIVVRQSLLIVGTDTSGEKPIVWVNLETRDSGFYWTTEGLIVPRQSLVMYEDVLSKRSVLVGFGPEQTYFARHQASNLAFATVAYNLEDPTLLPPVRLDYPSTDSISPRTGHSAVLSSVGNMYIFGGSKVVDDRNNVWTINIGGKECGINHHDENDSFDPYNDYYIDDAFSDDDQQTDNGSGFIMLIFMFIQFGLCFVGGNRRQRQGGEQRASATPLRGLTPEQLDTLPQRLLCESDDRLEESNVCSICLLEFCDGDEVRDLPCKHFFHKMCVDSWLASETTCPLCRISCRAAIEARELEQQLPSRASDMLQWLRRDHREAINTNGLDGDEGLEMGSVYSLDLQVEHADDDVSILSTTSASVGTTTPQPSSEATNERRERRRRRILRGGGGEGAFPLTAVQDSAMV